MALPVRDFIVQRLLEFDPNFDVGTGVPTTGLLIDPLSVILQPIIDELSVVQASQSVLTILDSGNPDAFPEDIVDGLASNVFVVRNTGSVGSDVMRVRFFSPQAFAAPLGGLVFLGPSGQRYASSESVSISSAEMSLNRDGALYYIDIPIVSVEEGSDFNAGAGSIVTMELEPVGVSNVTNLFGVTQGKDRETNTELIDRIKVAVTVRALVTGRGIIVTLTENFTTIDEIVPIGFGDPEMMRDIVHNTHIGGNVDVYVKTPSLISKTKDFFGLEVDATRRSTGVAPVVADVANVYYDLGRAPIDTTNYFPIVKSIDSAFTYVKDIDYMLNLVDGKILRKSPGGSILHIAASGVSSNIDNKTIVTSVTDEFKDVRVGMVVTITSPAQAAGQYTVKQILTDESFIVWGTIPGSHTSTMSVSIDENLLVTYEYNPVAIDIKAVPRTDRSEYTITDTPMMLVESIEILDPLSGEPTGVIVEQDGGYGTGGFGVGGFGVGAGAEGGYWTVVSVPTKRHSYEEDLYLEFGEAFAGLSVRVTYLHAASVPAIQAFMDDRGNQSQSASLLARHFIPVYVDGLDVISYDIDTSDESTALTVEEMEALVKDLINDVDEGGALEVADIVDLMYDNGAVNVDLSNLMNIRGEIHNHDGSVEFVSPESDGSMRIPDEAIEDPTDKPLSPRIARFRARDIVLERNLV